MSDWQRLLIQDDATIDGILSATRRVAVLGMKTERQAGHPAFDVPLYLAGEGLDIVPVPVHDPEVRHIMGREVMRRLAEVSPPADMIDVFRRAQDIPAHVEDMIAARPATVWFQLGIRNDDAAERLARAGIRVVQDRCLRTEHRRWLHTAAGAGR